MKDDLSAEPIIAERKKENADVIPFTAKVLEPKMTVLEPEIKETEAKPEIVLEVIPMQSRNLKVYFAFNGHDWEAYEAIGVPVNAPLTTVTKMYQHLIKTSDASTFDFFESAYQAILKRRRDRS
ncbi:MAG: hypothetical protein H7328_06550 [Bdellovibrio sp.]|nr:hypothetical protein [Bdellovibrio sp.]